MNDQFTDNKSATIISHPASTLICQANIYSNMGIWYSKTFKISHYTYVFFYRKIGLIELM